jgi:LysR family transcriptional activator of dmlA
MNKLPSIADLQVFTLVARKSSFSGAANELGLSAAYVSKRIRLLEADLSTSLFHRTTRRVVVTEDGERVYQWAQRILDNVDQLLQEVSATKRDPRGMLRICSSFGFGRNIVGPAISVLACHFPQLNVRFEVFDRLVDVASEGIDLDVRVGDEIAPHLIARRLASNYRVLCASPDYLRIHGTPRKLIDLSHHDCLVIKERDHPFGIWKLRRASEEYSVKVTGSLSTNQGEIATRWAIDGRGVLLRSIWDVAPYLRSGQLVRILIEYTQEANIWAVYPSRLHNSAKLRACVEFLQHYFERFFVSQKDHQPAEGRFLDG